MSTVQRVPDELLAPAAQELNMINVAGDYHDHHSQTTAYHYHTTSHHDHRVTYSSSSRIGPLDRKSTIPYA